MDDDEIRRQKEDRLRQLLTPEFLDQLKEVLELAYPIDFETECFFYQLHTFLGQTPPEVDWLKGASIKLPTTQFPEGYGEE